VRFSKDGTMLQLTAIDGRRATVVLPNDPDLVDILARNGVDISVSEGDQQGERSSACFWRLHTSACRCLLLLHARMNQ
jgi:cell division protease FtsH